MSDASTLTPAAPPPVFSSDFTCASAMAPIRTSSEESTNALPKTCASNFDSSVAFTVDAPIVVSTDPAPVLMVAFVVTVDLVSVVEPASLINRPPALTLIVAPDTEASSLPPLITARCCVLVVAVASGESTATRIDPLPALTWADTSTSLSL